MNRGHRGRRLFVDDSDRRRFLGAVSELPERFGLEVHAFVLMANHYHLLVRTTEANLSQAIRWLNGALDSPWAGLAGGIVLGEAEYARKLRCGGGSVGRSWSRRLSGYGERLGRRERSGMATGVETG